MMMMIMMMIIIIIIIIKGGSSIYSQEHAKGHRTVRGCSKKDNNLSVLISSLWTNRKTHNQEHLASTNSGIFQDSVSWLLENDEINCLKQH